MTKNKVVQSMVVFNWKMNPSNLKEARQLLKQLQKIKKKIIICPPSSFIYTLGVENKNRNITFAVQNISETNTGSLTGENSASMSTSVGASFAIIGHSERRINFAADDERVSMQVKSAVENMLTPIVCFGETKRDKKGSYISVLEKQLHTSISQIKKKDQGGIVFAYEPVWAIGKDAIRPITEEELFSTIILVRRILGEVMGNKKAQQAIILYGGSVSDQNVNDLVQVPGVNGFLVGRASLDAKKVQLIAEAVSIK